MQADPLISAVPSTRPAEDLLRLRARLVELARSRGRSDIVEELHRAGAPRRDLAATVVVVGETKRGKSSFINALIGEDVSPVDTDLATNTYLFIRHASRPVAWVHRGGGRPPDRVAPASACEWVTVAGNPDNSKGVRAFEIGLDSPLLARGLRLVDTPGVCGLDASHREVTLAALRQADVLMFVLDAAAPLSLPEYRFLRDATRSIATVLFVLTKVDAYVEWETIATDDRALIAVHAPEFADAPLLPVSNVDKRDGDRYGDDTLRRTSGFDAVERALDQRVIARGESLRLANLAHTLSITLSDLERQDRVALSMPTGDRELEQALVSVSARQAQYHRVTETWPSKLSIEYQRGVRNQLEAESRRRFRALLGDFEARIRTGEVNRSDLPEVLDAELRALAMDLDGQLIEAASRLAASVARLYEVPADDLLAATDANPLPPLDLPEIPAIASAARKGEHSVAMRGVSAVVLGMLSGSRWSLLLGPQTAVVNLGIGGLLGGLTWGATNRSRRQIESEHEAMSLLRSALEAARIEVDTHLRDRVLELQGTLQEELRNLIARRRNELVAQVDQHRRRKAVGDAQRERQRREAATRLHESEPLRAAIVALEQALIDGLHEPTIVGGETTSSVDVGVSGDRESE